MGASVRTTVDVSVDGDRITRLLITSLTRKTSGVNAYRWLYTRHDLGGLDALVLAREASVERDYEDGTIALIAKVPQAASQTEVAASCARPPGSNCISRQLG
jgi:hypothetical protein